MSPDSTTLQERQTFEDFELIVGRRTHDGYEIRVPNSPAGRGRGFSDFLPDHPKLLAAIAAIGRYEIDWQGLRDVGEYLFCSLFPDKIENLYRESLAIARREGITLCIRLHLEDPELQAIPWEFLFDANEDEDQFVARSTDCTIARYLPIRSPLPSSETVSSLRILAIFSNPNDADQLDIQKEVRFIREALSVAEQSGSIVLTVLENATVSAILDELRTTKPHIIHFVGHGDFDGATTSILLEDVDGTSKRLDDRSAVQLFTSDRSVRIVVLNACNTGRSSRFDSFVGLAPKLLRRNLAAVVAMQAPIGDEAAAIFTRSFYASLAESYPIDVALTDARRMLRIELGADDPTWGIPVLLLHARTDYLFQIRDRNSIDDSGGSTARLGHSGREVTPFFDQPPKPRQPPSTIHFTGRGAELRRYRAEIERNGIAIIAGFPGVGKSSMASQLASTIATREQIFWYDFKPEDTLETMLHSLARFLYWRDKPQLWQAIQNANRTVGKYLSVDTLIDFAIQLLDGGAYVLCFDDLHYVDEDPLVGTMIRRLQPLLKQHKLKLIVATRRRPPFVGALGFEPLQGLSLDDMRDLFLRERVRINDQGLTDLYHMTEGNAALLFGCLDRLSSKEEAVKFMANLGHAEDIQSYIFNELDQHLSEEEREVEIALALLSIPSTREAIEHLTQKRNTWRTILGLCERYLLNMVPSGALHKYGQNSLLQEFYSNVPSQKERQQMHRLAATLYLQQERDYLRAGEHFLWANLPAKAAQIWGDHFQEILTEGHGRTLALLMDRVANSFTMEADDLAKVQLAHGITHTVLGNGQAAIQALNEALQQTENSITQNSLTPKNGLLRTQVHRRLADVMQLESFDGAEEHCREGLALIDLVKDAGGGFDAEIEAEEAELLITYSSILIGLGRWETAYRTIDRALTIAERRYPTGRLRALMNLAHILGATGEVDQAIALAEEALKLCQTVGDIFAETVLQQNLGIDNELAGRWNAAQRHYEAALVLAEQTGKAVDQADVHNSLGILLMKRGHIESSYDHLEKALAIVEDRSLTEVKPYILTSLIDVALASENLDEAIPLLGEADRIVDELGQASLIPVLLTQRTALALVKGQTDLAAGLAHRAVASATEQGQPLESGNAYRLLGEVMLAKAETEAAIKALKESIELLAPSFPYETALSRFSLAVALDSQNMQSVAREQRSLAKMTFDTLGISQ